MLKMTGIKLEKISDLDKYLFIGKGLKDMQKRITNIQKIMILKTRKHLQVTWL